METLYRQSTFNRPLAMVVVAVLIALILITSQLRPAALRSVFQPQADVAISLQQ